MEIAFAWYGFYVVLYEVWGSDSVYSCELASRSMTAEKKNQWKQLKKYFAVIAVIISYVLLHSKQKKT